MKILVISQQVGRTAPGIVYERIISGLSKGNKITLITNRFEPGLSIEGMDSIINSKYFNIRTNHAKISYKYLGVNIVDFYWAISNYIKIIRRKKDFDIIISFLSYHNYADLISGVFLSWILNKKHIVYSVDAVPAPLGWSNLDLYYKRTISLIKKYLSKVDAYIAPNLSILEYQKKLFDNSNTYLGYLIPPISGEFQNFPDVNEDYEYFIYTGSVYGLRKINNLLNAFINLVEIFPNAKLIFVGTKFTNQLDEIPDTVRKKIEIHPSVSDLSNYYCMATALIDIDADLEGDIYISSKIINYLNTNRLIISETNLNSPSRVLFGHIDSILFCEHDSTELYYAMIKSIQLRKSFDFGSRLSVVSELSLKSFIFKFEKVIQRNIFKLNS